MNVLRWLLALAAAVPVASATDFSTPESAVRALEDAYIQKDIEAAVAAKDFTEEARLMLVRISPELADDAETLNQTAEVLELSFRKQIQDEGFPELAELRCSLSQPDHLASALVKLTETCEFPDGGKSVEDLHVFKGADGWRVVVVASDP
jgi:hypothetical protein